MLTFQDQVLKVSSAAGVLEVEEVQTLWSGYGHILRYVLEEGKFRSVIVKHVQWPEERNHPRGWNTSVSHQRKQRSYEVEQHWYTHQARLTDGRCKIPELYHAQELTSGMLLIMEDLDASGYSLRATPTNVSMHQVKSVLTWLAHFHALFLSKSPEGLWSIGTYWHLDTRMDEWHKMRNMVLKSHARAIDQRLRQSRFQTFVHGDAKLANFCFDVDHQVAAVDFQYIGQGCGMKDVAYFLSSCFEESDCEKYEIELLDHYFHQLKEVTGPEVDFDELEKEWRALYPIAWADFYRFLDGWSPGHWKMHGYSRKLTQRVIEELK